MDIFKADEKKFLIIYDDGIYFSPCTFNNFLTVFYETFEDNLDKEQSEEHEVAVVQVVAEAEAAAAAVVDAAVVAHSVVDHVLIALRLCFSFCD